MQFRTFLFDLDGTLIDHFTAIHRCYAHTLPQLGLPEPTLAQVRDAVGGGLENALLKFIRPDQVPAAVKIYRAYWDRTMLDDVLAKVRCRSAADAPARQAVLPRCAASA